MIGYFLKMKLKTFFFAICAISTLIFIIYEVNIYINFLQNNVYNTKLPIILWWTPFYNNNLTKVINCDINKCILTEDRLIPTPEKMVYIFYGSKFETHDLPVPRKKSDLWAIIHEESPKNLALFLYKEAQNLFNFTSTFSRYSNFPITLQYLQNIDALSSQKYVKSIEEKNELLKELSPVLYIQSDCVTPLERDSYVTELMKYISIDSYGQCLNSKKLPKNLLENPLNNLYSDDFMNFVAQYKFAIAFENAICNDYITEKLWRPLIAGTVPIYMGSPSVKDWIPNNTSVILADDFKSPKDLAEYISKLNRNDELYKTHLQHKFFEIENKKLIETLEERRWTIDDFEGPHFFEAFECYICDNVDNISSFPNIYDCPDLISPLTKKKNESNWWNQHWKEGKCQAKVLKQFMEKATNFTKEIFDHNVNQLLVNDDC